MKKTLAFLLLLAIIIMPANAVEKENVKPVKNVILLIPDGTSLATISIARWLQWYQDPSKPKLNIDPYCAERCVRILLTPLSATPLLLHHAT